MGDKAQNSHIERTVYVSPDVQPGSSLRYGSWEDREDLARRCSNCCGSGKASDRSWRDVRCDVCRGSGRVTPLPLTIIECATGSDYSGSLVEISNARVLKREFPWLVEIHGGHGTHGVAYLGRRENQSDALIEMIDSLCAYPLASDEDHSELEMESECEAWGDHGAYDFNRALMKYLDETDPGFSHELTDENAPYGDAGLVLLDLWRDGCEVFNINGGSGYCNEQGDSIHFYIREWFHFHTDVRFANYIDRAPYSGEQPSFRVRLAELSLATRVKE